jgi:hypothetical protein
VGVGEGVGETRAEGVDVAAPTDDWRGWFIHTARPPTNRTATTAAAA